MRVWLGKRLMIKGVLGQGRDVQIEHRAIDLEEEEKVAQFCCGCKMQCSSCLSQEQIRVMRANVAQLDRTALDMAIMSNNGFHQL